MDLIVTDRYITLAKLVVLTSLSHTATTNGWQIYMQNCYASIDHLAPLGEPLKKITSVLYSIKEELILHSQETLKKLFYF